MDTTTIRAFRDELLKIAASEAEEANKLFGLPVSVKPSGTRDYELGQAHDEQVAMEQQAEADAQAMEQQAAMAAAAPAPKPKKKPEAKKGGDQKVKVEVKVDGAKGEAKKSSPNEPKKPKSD